jgi:hypothetical protein
MAVIAGVVVVLALAGCGSDDEAEGQPAASTSEEQSSSSASTASTSTTSAAPTDPSADCLVGEWALDTADYQAQAFEFMAGLGIPVDALTISGEQVVAFQDRGVMEVRTDLVVDATVYGYPLSVPSQSAGNGEWSVEDGSLSVENWIWGVEPTPTAPDQPSVPFFDPAAGASAAVCEGDALQLQGPGAPLVGNFVRR